MRYYSTNHICEPEELANAVIKGLAADRGLFMPERIERLPDVFFENIGSMAFNDIAFHVATAFFGEDIDSDSLRRIVDETLTFDCPLVEISQGINALELFHGPTLAFKDVGARFMARMLSHFISKDRGKTVNVLVATSGDTGSAVANGFLGVEGIHVYVLYPKGKVSKIQECQFTTLGQNITALEIDGTFDDCQALVKNAFMDKELNEKKVLTSANSINVARFLPQTFYYFHAYANIKNRQQKAGHEAQEMVISVPSGNFGNLTAALFAHRMGLPVKRFIAANNANDVFFQFLRTGEYIPRPSIATIANAMDVGDPSNFARILDIYDGDHQRISSLISGTAYSDDEIRLAMRSCYQESGYILDPHGACGYLALKELLNPGETGVFCETAHPAKFKDTVEEAIGTEIAIPERLKAFMHGKKQSIPLSKDFASFRNFLLQ